MLVALLLVIRTRCASPPSPSSAQTEPQMLGAH